jgi:hypothetical protein
MPTPQRGRESIEIAAPPELVYDLLADITRMGEWSPECYRCVWLDGAGAAGVGTRFRGYNRLGPYRWEREQLSIPVDQDFSGGLLPGLVSARFVGSLDELAVLELRAGTDERDQVWCIDRAPA